MSTSLAKLAVLGLVSLWPIAGFAQAAFQEDGNIFYRDASGTTRQLTNAAIDSDPALSPDGRFVIFVRDTPDRLWTRSANEPAQLKELWRVNIDGGNSRLLLRGHGWRMAAHCRDRDDCWDYDDYGILEISNPQFSSDCRSIFFEARNTTSADGNGLIYRVGVDGKTPTLIAFGDRLQVLRGCDFHGCLVVRQKKRFLGPGGYDFFWLVTPEGYQLDAVGSDEGDVGDFREIFHCTEEFSCGNPRLGSQCHAPPTNSRTKRSTRRAGKMARG